MVAEQTIAINRANDVVTARNAGRVMARELGFGATNQTRLATAISELTRNICQHAGSGVCIMTDTSDGAMIRLHVVVEDQGPGIADLATARMEGFSTRSSMGMGLVAVERLVHTFEIESERGHTRIGIGIVQRRFLWSVV